MPRKLVVEIVGDASNLSRTFANASKASEGLGSRLARLGKLAAIGLGAAGFGGALITLKRGFDELADAQQKSAQTAAVLKSTGQAANVTQKQVEGLAGALQLKSGADDQAVQAGENMLLTFTRIRNEVGKGNDIFTQAAKGTLDMATAMNQGAVPSAEQMAKQSILVGKALNDPIRGMGALRRVGVAFTADQQKQIKALVDSGKSMEAQKLILRELNTEFGGSAEAAGKTLPGQLNILKGQFDNLAATIAARLLPTLNNILEWVNSHWPQISAVFNAVADAIGVAIGAGTRAVQAIIPIVQTVVAWFQQNWPKISEIATSAFDKIAPVVLNTFTTIRGIISGAVAFIQAIWERYGEQIKSQTEAVWGLISSTIKNAMEMIRGIVNIIGGLLHGDFGRVWEGIKQVFGAQINQIVTLVKYFGTTLQNILTVAGQALLELMRTAWNGIVGVITSAAGRALAAAAGVGQGIKDGVVRGLAGLVDAVRSAFQTLWAFIKNAAGSAYAYAFAIGGRLVDGLIGGLKAIAGKVKDAVHTYITGPISDAIHSIPGFSPPEHVGRWLGEQLVKGLTEALKAGESQVATSMKGVTGSAVSAIVTAAKKAGVEARAALAVAMTEGGTSFGAVGDKGTSFGPFQLHIGGANPYGDPKKASEFANSIKGVTYALNQMASAGAAGKTGFDAIKAIVYSFERPANPAAEVSKALAYYKDIPAQLGSGLAAAGAQTSASTVQTLTQIATLVRNASKVIGLDHARQVVAGMLEGSPGIVAQARAALAEAMAAAQQAVTDGRAGFTSAFESLANAALGAFDQAMAKWKPPAQRILDQMQIEDQINAAKKAVADAQAAVNAAVNQQLADINAGPSEGETEADYQKRLAADQAAVTTAAEQLGAAQRSATEVQLGLQAQQQQTAHDKRVGKQREQLAQQLGILQTELEKHPAEWEKTSAKIVKLLEKYHVPMFEAGQKFASRFADGLRDGIAAVAKAARELAAALDKYVPHSPAKTGPLSYDIYKVGRQWASDFGRGVASAPAAGLAGVGLPAAGIGGGGGAGIVVNVAGSVVTERQLVDNIHAGLLRKQGQNSTLGLTKGPR